VGRCEIKPRRHHPEEGSKFLEEKPVSIEKQGVVKSGVEKTATKKAQKDIDKMKKSEKAKAKLKKEG